MRHIQVASNYQDFQSFSENIKTYFSKSDDVITAKRNIIKIITYHDKKVVIKSFKIPNLINQFAYRFIRASKAKRSYINAQKLIKLDVSTPVPIAYIEFFTPFLKESFYLCEHFDFDFEIRDVLNDHAFKDRERIFEELAQFSYSLHEKGIYHIDYSPGNILIKKVDGVYHFSIVDVNRMKFLEFDDELRFKNLSRFSANKKDTTYIAKSYANFAGLDETFAIEKLFFYHDIHQKYLKNKSRLKQLKS